MKTISLSKELSLPVDIAGEAIGILANRGAGKSFTSAVIVEELFAAGIQFVVFDPTGVYWGLRSSASGKRQGLPVFVLGGAHGDVPLEDAAGNLIADLVVDNYVSLVLDLSDFPTKSAQTRFMIDFSERLFHRKSRNRTTIHLIIDEAEEFAPQQIRKGSGQMARLLGSMERLIKRGRSRGIGATLITQRSASLNKNVLDLVDTMIVMRIGSPRDRKAVDDWISAKALSDELGVINSLPSMPTGTAWIWSPVREILQKVGIRRIKTFDSYATPKPGKKRIVPKVMASIDIQKLGKEISNTAERAKENDPDELKKRIRELERELAKKPEAAEEVKIVEVPVITDKQIEEIRSLLAKAESYTTNVAAGIDRILSEARAAASKVKSSAEDKFPGSNGYKHVHHPEQKISVNSDLTNPQRRILDSLEWWRSTGIAPPYNKIQVAFIAGYSPKSSGFLNLLSALKSGGYIEYAGSGNINATEKGIQNANIIASNASQDELHRKIQEKLSGPQWRVLEPILAMYPNDANKAEIAEKAGYSASSSGYLNLLSSLRSLKLIDYPYTGAVKAESFLFI